MISLIQNQVFSTLDSAVAWKVPAPGIELGLNDFDPELEADNLTIDFDTGSPCDSSNPDTAAACNAGIVCTQRFRYKTQHEVAWTLGINFPQTTHQGFSPAPGQALAITFASGDIVEIQAQWGGPPCDVSTDACKPVSAWSGSVFVHVP